MNIKKWLASGAVEIPEARKFMASRLTDFQSRKGAHAPHTLGRPLWAHPLGRAPAGRGQVGGGTSRTRRTR